MTRGSKQPWKELEFQSKSKQGGKSPKKNIKTTFWIRGTSNCSGNHKDTMTKGCCKNNSIFFNISSELLLLAVDDVELLFCLLEINSCEDQRTAVPLSICLCVTPWWTKFFSNTNSWNLLSQRGNDYPCPSQGKDTGRENPWTPDDSLEISLVSYMGKTYDL